MGRTMHVWLRMFDVDEDTENTCFVSVKPLRYTDSVFDLLEQEMAPFA
jgi:hypothetical protein